MANINISEFFYLIIVIHFVEFRVASDVIVLGSEHGAGTTGRRC